MTQSGRAGLRGWVGIAAAVLLSALSALGAVRAAPGGPAAEAWPVQVQQHWARQPALAGLRVLVDPLPDSLGPPACALPLAVSGGQRAPWWGVLSVGLVCARPAWQGQVNVRVRAYGQAVQTGRPMPAGALLDGDSLRLVEVDMVDLPAGSATELTQVVGREATRPLRENSWLPLNALRAPTVIKVGERVMVKLTGAAFQVWGDGVAQQSGGVGDSVRVKLPDGKLLQALVVRAGLVELKL